MPKNNSKKFIEDLEYRIYRIKHFGKKYGWNILMSIDELIIFTNKDLSITISINAKTLMIETELNHPKKGETKLMRKGSFTMKLIEKIFRNPRVHTPNNIKTDYIK